jgi:hypothetical protein
MRWSAGTQRRVTGAVCVTADGKASVLLSSRVPQCVTSFAARHPAHTQPAPIDALKRQ